MKTFASQNQTTATNSTAMNAVMNAVMNSINTENNFPVKRKEIFNADAIKFYLSLAGFKDELNEMEDEDNHSSVDKTFGDTGFLRKPEKN